MPRKGRTTGPIRGVNAWNPAAVPRASTGREIDPPSDSDTHPAGGEPFRGDGSGGQCVAVDG